MIRTRRFTGLGWFAGPLVLAAMASGQESKPAPKEVSVPVTGGSVTVVEDGKKPADSKSAARQAVRKAAEVQREKARATQAEARARVQNIMARQAPGAKPGPSNRFRANPDPVFGRLGLELAEADDALRAQLSLEPETGLVVVAVAREGVADRSGLKPNDVVTALDKSPVRSIDQARTRLVKLGKDPIEVRALRGGQPIHLFLAGPEHGAGFTPELTEFWIGVPITPVDATLRSQLPDLPADAGLVANEVVSESPAAKAGVKKNDILVKLGDKPLKDASTLIAQVQASGDKPTPLELLRGGKPITVTITPARRARAVALNAVAVDPTDAFRSYYSFFVTKPGVAVDGSEQREEIVNRVGEQREEILKRLEEAMKGMKDGQVQVADQAELVKQIGKAMEGMKAGQASMKPVEVHLEMLKAQTKEEVADANARIEASMKELRASIDELKKAIGELKKPEDKKSDKE